MSDVSAAINRLHIHGRLIDYPGGEIGFERDARLAAQGMQPREDRTAQPGPKDAPRHHPPNPHRNRE